MERKKTRGFSSKIGFILAAAGSAVGLGNLWRFPYVVTKYGGGAFLITYILMVIILGYTVMIAEMLIGRTGRSQIIDNYGRRNRWFKWIGILALSAAFIISAYYSVIGGWTLNYAVNYIVNPSGNNAEQFAPFITSTFKAPIYAILFMVITIVIVAKGIDKGIEKVSKILFPLLFILVVMLAIYSLTLKKAGEGLKVYLGTFNFEKLGFEGVMTAMSQAFYSLSLGMGAMVAYGAYTNKKTNIAKSAIYIAGLDTGVAFLSGIIIYPALYTYAKDSLDVTGPGLLFKVMPTIFTQMPGGHLIGLLFFILVLFAALTSIISLFEVVSQLIVMKGYMSRKQATWTFGIISAFLSVLTSVSFNGTYGVRGATLLDFFDGAMTNILLPLVALLSILMFGWSKRAKDIYQEIKDSGTDFKGKQIWLFFIRFIDPILISVVLIGGCVQSFKNKKDFPADSFTIVIIFTVLIILASLGLNVLINSAKFKEFIEKRKENKKIQLEKINEHIVEL